MVDEEKALLQRRDNGAEAAVSLESQVPVHGAKSDYGGDRGQKQQRQQPRRRITLRERIHLVATSAAAIFFALLLLDLRFGPAWTQSSKGVSPFSFLNHHLYHHCPGAAASRRLLDGVARNARIVQQSIVPESLRDLQGPTLHEKFFENIYLAIPSAEEARGSLQRLTGKAHIAGSEQDYQTSLDVLNEWGSLLGARVPENESELVFDAGSPEAVRYMTGTRDEWRALSTNPIGDPRVWVDTYSVWLNTPISSSLTLSKEDDTTSPYFTASLKEDVVPQDPTSGDGPPTFHGYSKTGKARGPIVYAGLCTVDDFKQLEKHNVSVKGAITLCRYGGPFRGLKVRLSAEHGAVGTLIYSDPLVDGKITEANGYTAYPDGPARHPTAVQRGSVQALSIYPGDAGTPGQPSYRNASRLDPDTADALPKIPSFPISYRDAKPFLEAMVGKGASAEELGSDKWQGAVPGIKEYWTGPSSDIVEMDNQMTDIAEVHDIWNTYAMIPGVIEDEVVIVSNHRDAWTFGAADPSSGTAVLHEVVRGLGALTQKGWRPLRTILIANWDAEEYGLIGSTEAAEDYADFFKNKAVMFINTDVAVSGSEPLVRCSPSLADYIVQAASEIKDPKYNGTDEGIAVKKTGPLGSGSDYTAYLQNLGIASLDVGLVQGDDEPIYQYHSNYDSFFWQDKFGDPGFKRHLAMAQWVGLLTLRSSQGIFLPLNITSYASALTGYLNKVQKIAPKELNVGPLEDAITGVQEAARNFEAERAHVQKKIDAILDGGVEVPRQPSKELRKLFAKVCALNRRAKLFETGFLAQDGKGLAGRDFYKHLGVAPGRYLGYGATTFPGLTESITLDDGHGTKQELERLVKALHQVRKNVEGHKKGENHHHDRKHHHRA